jgi:phytoene dehydrogenase-like protein
MDMDEADIVVAGAGHNSLIAAAYLAKAGFRVIVLEARDVIGGNTVTEELTLPGFRHDSCSSAHVLIQSNPLLRNDELGLGRYGLKYVLTDPALVMPFEDGASITMWRNRQRTADEIRRFSPRDARAYIDFLEAWDELKTVHGRVSNLPPAELDLDTAEAKEYARLAALTAHDVVFERFDHPHVRSFVLWLAFATIQDPRRPGTGVLPMAVTAGRQEFGWTTPLGGSGMLPTALARLIEAHGGRVVTGAPVAEVTVAGGRATGCVTASGDHYRAHRAVLSTIHAARLHEVLPPGALPDRFTRRLEAWRPGITLFAVHLALSKIPRFAAETGGWIESTAGAFGSADGLIAQIDAHDEGRTYDADPWILVVNSCVVDPDRAPAGSATLKLLTVAPRAADWDRERDRFARVLLQRVASRMDFDAGDVLAMVAECPLDLERRNPHNHLGSCHGGELSPEQSGLNRPVPGYAQYRMPVDGLYQTGATTHPGGSVSGRPGRNAARVMLADLGVDPSTLMT